MSGAMIILVISLAIISEICATIPNLDHRIVGGKNASILDYPYQVSLRKSNGHICGGSIIHSLYILTAAHCVYGGMASTFSIRAGSSLVNKGGKIIKICGITVHENYNQDTMNNDIAILKDDATLPKVSQLRVRLMWVRPNCSGEPRRAGSARRAGQLRQSYSYRIPLSSPLQYGRTLNDLFVHYTENLGAFSEEQGERMHQDLSDFEKIYQGASGKNMLADYCWCLKKDTNVEHKENQLEDRLKLNADDSKLNVLKKTFMFFFKKVCIPLTFSDKVLPIALPETGEQLVQGTKAFVTGWGFEVEYGRLPSTLKQVEVPIVPHTDCNKLYSQYGGVTDNMICAGYLKLGGKDACQGDSGGPLRANGKLMGVVSWGFGCAKPNYPGVYTKVSNYRNWIRKITNY